MVLMLGVEILNKNKKQEDIKSSLQYNLVIYIIFMPSISLFK